MLTKEILIKRLALIKYLFIVGIEQSKQVDTIAAFSILSFHDSIEMFLKLISEHHEIKSEKFSFMDYWEKVPNLTHKESLRNLNSIRVNIKHKGLLPSKSDIEISRVNTIDFFNQNTLTQFNIEFNEVSLLTLISYDNVRAHLEKSQSSLLLNNFEECVSQAAIAFYELLETYENSKRNYYSESFFFFGKEINTFMPSLKMQDRDMEIFVKKVKESIDGIQKAIKILSFGIDYKKYVKFKLLTPEIERLTKEIYVRPFRKKVKWTNENCQYCIDFVLDCSLKFQEFDFDINEIEEQNMYN